MVSSERESGALDVDRSQCTDGDKSHISCFFFSFIISSNLRSLMWFGVDGGEMVGIGNRGLDGFHPIKR